jgi:hypothetical protein
MSEFATCPSGFVVVPKDCPRTPSPSRGKKISTSTGQTVVECYDDSDEQNFQTPQKVANQVVESVTVDRLSRKTLDDAFGNGFSDQGFTKRGHKTGEVEVSSPAVKLGLVHVSKDGKIDQRSAAAKQKLVVFDQEGNVIKKDSVLCQQQIVFTDSAAISQSSAGVKNGLVLLKKDGNVDKRSTAVKNGWLVVDGDGEVEIKDSIICQPTQLHLVETNGAHIHGFEVADKIAQCEYL